MKGRRSTRAFLIPALAALLAGACEREPDGTEAGPLPEAVLAVDVDALPDSVRSRLLSARAAAVDSPDDAEAVGLLGMLYLVNGSPAEAALCFERAAELESDQLSWPYYSGLTYATLEDTDRAVAAFERTLALDDSYAPALVELALQLVGSDVARAETLLRRAIELKPDLAPAHVGLGHCARIQGRRGDAVDYFEQAVRLDPKLAEAHYELAMLFRTDGRMQEAARHLRLFESGRSGSELTHLDDPLRAELFRRVAGARVVGGGTLRKVSRVPGDRQTIAFLEQTVEKEPDSTSVHSKLGVAYLRQGRHREAAEQFRWIVERYPEHVEDKARLARAVAGLGRHEEAEQLFREALDRQPDNDFVLNRFGIYLVRRGRGTEALPLLRRAVEVQPGRGAYRYSLARLLARRGRDREAIEHLEVAVELNPRHGEATALLATLRGAPADGSEP